MKNPNPGPLQSWRLGVRSEHDRELSSQRFKQEHTATLRFHAFCPSLPVVVFSLASVRSDLLVTSRDFNRMPLRDAARDYAACVLTLILPVYACLGLRFYVRRSRKHIGPDDWCMVPGAFFFAGLTVTSLIGAWNGIGTHEWNLAEDETPRAAMWLTIGSLWFFATVLCTKLAIAFMLCRVARGRHNYIHALHACMALFTVTILAGCMYLILHCRPFAYNWDKGITGGACRHPNNVKVIYYTITSTDIATNWFCALLPIPLLWNVQMDLRHKISVVACMSLGFL